MLEWKRFDEDRPHGGDTIIVFDPGTDEFAVFIYGETEQQEGYLSEAWQFIDIEWEPEPEWLWMPCPIPPKEFDKIPQSKEEILE